MEENKKQEQFIGKITHFFDKISVAVVELSEGDLRIGETIRIQGPTTDFQQVIVSMQVDHEDVAAAFKGDSVGLKADQPVKANDAVYKVIEE